MVGRYLKAIIQNAWDTTAELFVDTRQGYVYLILVFLCGLVWHAGYQGWIAAWDNAKVSLLTGFAASISAGVLLLFVNLLLAPYRLWKADNTFATETNDTRDHRAIAERLKSCITSGQALRQRSRSEHFNTDVRIWRATAEKIVEQCGLQELAMFQTLEPPNLKGAIYTEALRKRDLRILKNLIYKLRLIMGRQYDLALSQTNVIRR
jgi:hypothetical protein